MARLVSIKQLYASKAFRDLRFLLIIQRGCKCDKCGETFADTSMLVAHHKIELTADNVNDPAIALNPDNIGILCIKCHNEISNRFTQKRHSVYLVYGSPLSGKTTSVKDMAQRGDLIIDIDRIWEAVTLCPVYDKPNNVRFNIFEVRKLLMEHVRTRFGHWNDAYIIGGYPEKFERERVANEMGAQLIYCEATQKECVARLLSDETRRNVIPEWTRYIEEWWERYTA